MVKVKYVFNKKFLFFTSKILWCFILGIEFLQGWIDMVEFLNICQYVSGKVLLELLFMYVFFYLYGVVESFKSVY